MKKVFSKIKDGIGKAVTNIKKAFGYLKNKIKSTFNKIKNRNKQNKKNDEPEYEPLVSDENKKNVAKNEQPKEQPVEKTNTVNVKNDTKFRTAGHDTVIAPIAINRIQQNKVETKRETDNRTNQESETYLQDNDDNGIDTENAERIVSIDIKENIGIVEFETTTGKKYKKSIDDILKEKKNIYKDWDINKKCNDFAKNKIQALRLKRNLNPVVISTLNNEEDIDKYIKCVRDTDKIWFNLEHDLIDSKLKGKNARLMARVGKNEEKIGAKVKRKESLLERMLKKIRARNENPEEMSEELESIEEDNNELNDVEEEIVEDLNQEDEKQRRKNDYDVLVRGILGETAKRDIQEINRDPVYKDIYEMTSNDAAIKGVATFRMGHRFSLLSDKNGRKKTEKLLKAAISILNNDEVLAREDSLIEILQSAYMDLGNFYLRSGEFINAEKAFVGYMEAVRKEKTERYDPKILEARKNGKTIDEIDLWIDIKTKLTAGKKSMIKLLSKSGKKKEAETLYKKLLEDCKISLSDEEYQLSLKTNCIEHGKYMRITKGKIYREPILGNEYLRLRRKDISNKALAER